MYKINNIKLKMLKPAALFVLFLMISCSNKMSKEVEPFFIEIDGPMKNSNEEISGMDWYQDNLCLLPENLNGYVFFINKSEIDSRINKTNTNAIIPKMVNFNTPDYKNIIPGFDSFEAIAFRGHEVYLSIEIKFEDSMSCIFVRGHIDEKTLEITVPEQTFTTIDVPTYVDNLSYESLVIKNEKVYVLFEANGDSIISDSYAVSVTVPGNKVNKHPITNINYRITDATKIDKNDRFWAINYFFPRDKKDLKPSEDLLIKKYGQGPTHSLSERVERLVEYKIKNDRIVLTNNPHIEIKLEGEKVSRKWEALARYDKKGFLIATDKYPTPNTILAYIPYD